VPDVLAPGCFSRDGTIGHRHDQAPTLSGTGTIGHRDYRAPARLGTKIILYNEKIIKEFNFGNYKLYVSIR
jgi:hypothetical protein